MTKENLVSFYQYVDVRRVECSEVTLLEIAEEFIEKLSNSLPQEEAESVCNNEGEQKKCINTNGCSVEEEDRATYCVDCYYWR